MPSAAAVCIVFQSEVHQAAESSIVAFSTQIRSDMWIDQSRTHRRDEPFDLVFDMLRGSVPRRPLDGYRPGMGEAARTPEWGGPAYDRFVGSTEIPLLVLAVVFIPVLEFLGAQEANAEDQCSRQIV
jgi:hypothetical protein